MSTPYIGNGHDAVMSPQERLQARLSNPDTVDALNRLLDKLDVMTLVVDGLDGFLRRGDVVADSIANSLHDIKKMAPANGAQLVGSLPKLAKAGAQLADVAESPAVARLAQSGLLEQLGKPETIDALKALLSKLELLAFLAQALDGFLQRGEQIADEIGAGVRDLKEGAPALDQLNLKDTIGALPKLSAAAKQASDSGLLDKLPQLAETGAALVDSGIFDKHTVQILAQAGKTLAESYDDAVNQPRKQVGAVGLLRALNDPELQRSLGLFLDFAKRFGQRIK
jgi:uncharacterized protein YjgD (DUF1641 family)